MLTSRFFVQGTLSPHFEGFTDKQQAHARALGQAYRKYLETLELPFRGFDSSEIETAHNRLNELVLEAQLLTGFSEEERAQSANTVKKLHVLHQKIQKQKTDADIKKAIRNEIRKLDFEGQLKKEPFVPPKSPHHLLEEELYHDPWSLLVATIFLNKTSATVARPYVFWFLEENSHPLVVLDRKPAQLETYFGALGLQKTRAIQVWKMSHDFLYKPWIKVGELHGVGKYGEDAYRMFCLGDFSVEPNDRYLKIYKAWYQIRDERERFEEMNS